MSRPAKLEPATVDAWLNDHPSWQRHGADALTADFAFADFASALAFAVRVGCAAEKRNHHPDIAIGWGRARVTWSTHDAGGITKLDLELAETTARFAL